MTRAEPAAELRFLDPFVGIWDTDGEMVIDSEGQRLAFKATDTFEWLAGGFFLFHRFDAKLPAGHYVKVELFGYDVKRKQYSMHSFDSDGNASVMYGELEMENWTLIGERVLFSGGFRDKEKVFAALMEQRNSPSADWEPWMEVTMHKVE